MTFAGLFPSNLALSEIFAVARWQRGKATSMPRFIKSLAHALEQVNALLRVAGWIAASMNDRVWQHG